MPASKKPAFTDRAAALKEFKENGYYIVRGFFSPEEIDRLEAEVRVAPVRAPSLLNKGGLIFREYMYEKSPFLQGFLSQPKVVDLIKTFAGGNFWLRRDQAIFKTPGGVEFPWHQDNSYNAIPKPYFQFWVPLTKMNPENGGLFILPKSHKKGFHPHAYVGAHFAWKGDDSAAVPIRAERGDALVFSSFLLHRTGPNRTGSDRIAYVAEFISDDNFDPEARPPYFRIAQNGHPDPKFVRHYKGYFLPQNRLRHIGPFVRKTFVLWKDRPAEFVKNSLRKIFL